MGETMDPGMPFRTQWNYDPLINPADISVSNIKGNVALNGTVPGYPQYLEAAAAARRVAGVRQVHNHLQVVLPPEHYRDDAMLTTAANNTLARDVTVPDGVEATARDGNVLVRPAPCASAGSAPRPPRP